MILVAWLLGVAMAALMVFGLAKLLRKKGFSDEEYEREAARPSLLRTGLQELQGFLEPEKRAAIQVVREEKQKTDQTTPGDPP
jgi:hypothetical protein